MIPGLDGLRAISILMVFFYHVGRFNGGWMGVQLFFVLSGFLITDILLRSKDKFPAREYFIKFYGRRFLRIFPLYYFYLLLMAGITFWLLSNDFKPKIMQVFWDQLPVALTYTYDFFHASAFFKQSSFLTHFWSLSVEEQFYLIWPLIILLTPRKYLKQVFLAAIALGPLFRLLLTGLYRAEAFPLLLDNPSLAIYALPFSHVDAFAFGAYISRFEIPKPRMQFFILLTLIPLLGYASQWLFTGKIGSWSAFGYPLPLANGYKQIWGYSLLNYFFAVTIYAVARTGLFKRFLELGFLRHLGKISYGMYIYHYAIIWFTSIGMSVSQSAAVRLEANFIALGLTIVISTISYYVVEKPIMDLKDRFFHQTAAGSVPRSIPESGQAVGA